MLTRVRRRRDDLRHPRRDLRVDHSQQVLVWLLRLPQRWRVVRPDKPSRSLAAAACGSAQPLLQVHSNHVHRSATSEPTVGSWAHQQSRPSTALQPYPIRRPGGSGDGTLPIWVEERPIYDVGSVFVRHEVCQVLASIPRHRQLLQHHQPQRRLRLALVYPTRPRVEARTRIFVCGTLRVLVVAVL
jgi:hypothetical protein